MKYIIVRSDGLRLSLQIYTNLVIAIKDAHNLDAFFVRAGYSELRHFVEVI